MSVVDACAHSRTDAVGSRLRQLEGSHSPPVFRQRLVARYASINPCLADQQPRTDEEPSHSEGHDQDG